MVSNREHGDLIVPSPTPLANLRASTGPRSYSFSMQHQPAERLRPQSGSRRQDRSRVQGLVEGFLANAAGLRFK